MRGFSLHRILVLVGAGFLGSCATVAPPLPANVRIDPDPVAFGRVFVGDVQHRTAIMTNNTAAALTVTTSNVTAGTPFSAAAPPTLPAGVPPLAGAQPFRFDFTPTDIGNFTAKWTVNINGTDHALDLNGTGIGVIMPRQGMDFNPRDAWISKTDGFDFGTLVVGGEKNGRIEVVRTGADLVVRIPPTITDLPGNPRAGAFHLRKPTAPPATLTLVDQYTGVGLHAIGVEIDFRPTAPGTYKAILTITDANGAAVMRIFLKGVATAE